jgi:hypothetical protein
VKVICFFFGIFVVSISFKKEIGSFLGNTYFVKWKAASDFALKSP